MRHERSEQSTGAGGERWHTMGWGYKHLLEVDRRRDDLDVLQRELRALRKYLPVEHDERAAVVVAAAAIAAALVGVEVEAPALRRGRLQQLEALVELAQLVV